MNYHGIPPEWLFNASGWFYEVTSGPIVVLGVFTLWRKHNCHSPWCLRLGHHQLNDGTPVCRKHHPDLPAHKRTLAELHRDHEAAK